MNVVLLIIDSLRADHVGAYGSSVHTPNLDAFARGATVFTRAHPDALPTIPVRRAVHTGLRTYPCRQWERLQGNPAIPGGSPYPTTSTPWPNCSARSAIGG
ncbi:MAG: sulfatase-like hydrolase/transferase [Streptosporangiaceae bacterium]